MSPALAHNTAGTVTAAKRLAAAIGYMALSDAERAQVVTARDGRARAGKDPTHAEHEKSFLRLLRESGVYP